MKTYNPLPLFLFITLCFFGCKDDDLDCTSNTIIINDGREACVIMEVVRYDAPIDGDPEALFLSYSSTEVGSMDMTLYSFRDQTLEVDKIYEWFAGINFTSISGEETISGSATILDIDRANGNISFEFQVVQKRVNNNTYVISGSTSNLSYL